MALFDNYWKETDVSIHEMKFKPMWKLIPDDVTSVLDVGGGIGSMYHAMNRNDLKKENYCVLDSSEVAVDKAKESGLDGLVHNLDGGPLPLEDNTYDLVILSDVLEHLNNPLAVLSEASRASKKYVFVHGPNFAALKCRFDAVRGYPIRQTVTDRNGSLVDSRGRKANHIYYITYCNLIYWAQRASLEPQNISVFNRKKHKPMKWILEKYFRNLGEQYSVLFTKKGEVVEGEKNFQFY